MECLRPPGIDLVNSVYPRSQPHLTRPLRPSKRYFWNSAPVQIVQINCSRNGLFSDEFYSDLGDGSATQILDGPGQLVTAPGRKHDSRSSANLEQIVTCIEGDI